jgi:predicted TPR repeat methyltransferase
MTGPDGRSAQLLQSAIKAHQAGDLARAGPQYEAVLARQPEDPNALHFYGVLKHNFGSSDEGVALIRRSLTIAPQNPDAWLNLGNILLEQDRPEEAKTAYERSAALAPDRADAPYNLGICLRKMQDPVAATRALDRAIGLRPMHAPSHYQRGIARRDADDFAGAEADFVRALELRPDYTEVYESLGMLLYRQNRIADAAKAYQAWTKQDPGSSVAEHLAAATSGESTPQRGSDAYIKATFDQFAATFDQNLANLGYRAPRLVASGLTIAAGATPNLEAVLDVGCGTGLCGPFLRPLTHRLVGVDLSSGMVDRARAKGHYDNLYVDELGAFMRSHRAAFDAIVSADTFVYFGALEEVAAAAADCLRGAGTLVFTVEEMTGGEETNYRLEPHGRYTHRRGYVHTVLEQAGFTVAGSDQQVLRRERGADVLGLVIVARLNSAAA